MKAASHTWPAPPAASPWSSFTLRTVPPSCTAQRLAVRPAPRPVTRHRLPALLGVAMRFGEYFLPELGAGLPAGTSVAVAPGALDTSLAMIRVGHQRFRLSVGHHGPALLRAVDGCLEVFVCGDDLMVGLGAHNAAGRTALAAVKALFVMDHGELSVRLKDCDCVLLSKPGHARRAIVIKGTLAEVALVPRGAGRQCEWAF
jgi:hypothetical protein